MMSNNPPAMQAPPQPITPRVFVMPGLVLGFLGAHIVFIFIAITLAVGDPTFAVVPDYYQKGVAIETYKARLAASAAMGWEAEVTPSREVTDSGERELAVVLRDAAGEPITGAAVSAEMYHHARGADIVTAELAPTGEPGRYAASAAMGREGVWDITLEVSRGDESFLHHEKRYVRGRATGGRP